MSARACQRACAPSLKLKAERGFDESSELFPFLPVIWCRTNRRWPRADQRHFRTSVSASTLCRASGRKIKVVTVCARGVPRHAQRFIWNKTKIPKGLKTFLQRCRFELYMLCTLSALARGAADVREGRPATPRLTQRVVLLIFLLFLDVQIRRGCNVFSFSAGCHGCRTVSRKPQAAGRERGRSRWLAF